jgi:radical SAM superfamily enzyme YgiQ (UPF0313 family)
MRMIPNNSLLQVARLTPPGVEIEIVDENHSRIDWKKPYDLVGITSMSFQAKRAYALGDEFRKRGTKVVMGGFHSTFAPDECREHADAVVIGEAEGVWPRVIADFQRGKLDAFYQADKPSDLKNLPPPRYDLVPLRSYGLFNNYIYLPVSATRGCPYNCDFCSVRRFYRTGFRTRPVEEVIGDFRATGIRKSFFLADDNFIADRKYARELMEALISLKVEWIGQCDISIGRDPELLALARQSGLTMIYMGLETLNQENLREIKKGHLEVEKYPQYLRNLREAGIQVLASVVYGFDHDGPEVFRQMIDFLERHHVAGHLGYILNPFPGSDFSYRLGQENRYLDVDLKDWGLFDGAHVLFRPKKMSAPELESGFWEAYYRFYSLRSIFRRILWPPNISCKSGRSLIYSLRMLFWSWSGNMIGWFLLKTKRLHPFSRY